MVIFDSWNRTAVADVYPWLKYSWKTCLVLLFILSWHKCCRLCTGWLWIFLKVATHGWDVVKGSFHRVALVSSFITTSGAAGQLKKWNKCINRDCASLFPKVLSCLYFASTSCVFSCTLYKFISLLILTLCLSFVLFRVVCVGWSGRCIFCEIHNAWRSETFCWRSSLFCWPHWSAVATSSNHSHFSQEALP